VRHFSKSRIASRVAARAYSAGLDSGKGAGSRKENVVKKSEPGFDSSTLTTEIAIEAQSDRPPGSRRGPG
jgi:hypothetical protein